MCFYKQREAASRVGCLVREADASSTRRRKRRLLSRRLPGYPKEIASSCTEPPLIEEGASRRMDGNPTRIRNNKKNHRSNYGTRRTAMNGKTTTKRKQGGSLSAKRRVSDNVRKLNVVLGHVPSKNLLFSDGAVRQLIFVGRGRPNNLRLRTGLSEKCPRFDGTVRTLANFGRP